MYTHNIPRHKVFISYYHQDDQDYKNYLIQLIEYNPNLGRYQFIFDDYSVSENDIDDTGMSDEAVRKEIRDNYIKDATVLILLCGKHTKDRKFIDWEIHAAMFDTKNNPKLGILVINLPTLNGQNHIQSGQDDEKSIIGSPSLSWFTVNSRSEYEKRFPYLPSRIIDNYESSLNYDDIVPITIVDWDVIKNNNAALKTLIDNAYKRSRNKNLHYNYSAPLRSRNRRQ